MKSPEDLSKEQLIRDLIALRQRINELETIEKDKKKFEEELARAKAMFEGLFEFAPDAIVVVSREGRIVQVNREAERLFGYAREELIGADHDMLVPERFRKKHLEHRKAYMSEPHVRRMSTGLELYGRKKDGTEFSVDIALGPLQMTDDIVVLAVVRDFSERLKVYREIEHLASIARLNPNPLIEVDFSGKITYCNTAAGEVLKELGMERKDCRVFLPDTIRVIVDELSQKREEEPFYSEVAIKGRVFSEDIYLMPGLDVVRIYVQDITERKRAQEALHQKTLQLEAANKELEAFSYSVSHDLRAPLRRISGFSDIMRADHSAGLDEEGKRLLDSIKASVLRMDELIRTLLALSQAGRQEMHLRSINMEELVGEVFDEIRHGGSGQDLQLELKTLPPACGDAALMRQVFANLLSNAVKFTRHKDRPTIEVGGRSEDREDVYFVKDNGVGFEAKFAERLFGAFQRLHTSSEFEGTGIGLSIVQRIVARHGGRVWAEGVPDAGATFFFTLPRKESA